MESTADILATLRQEHPDAAALADRLEAALLDSPIPAAELMIRALRDKQPERALAFCDRFSDLVELRPSKDTAKDDLRVVVIAARALVPAGHFEAAIENLLLVPRLLADTPERPCMRPRRSCSGPECEYKFVGDEGRDLWVCPECGAPRTLCKNRGEPRCRFHSGSGRTMLHGLARRYEFGNQTIQELFEAQMEKGDLLNLEQDVAIARVRVGILSKRMEELDLNLSSKNVYYFLAVAQRFHEALAEEAWERALDLAREGMGYLEMRIEENSAWHEMERAQQHLRTLVEAEAKRQALADQLITPERLVEFLITLRSVIEMAVARHLEDARARRLITRDVGQSVDHLLRGEPVPQRMLPSMLKPKVAEGEWIEEKDGSD